MQLLLFGGLIIVVSSIIAIIRSASTDDSLQQKYVITGLTLMLLAVGSFCFGRGLFGVVMANSLDMSTLTFGGWIFAAPLIVTFLFCFSPRRKIQEFASRFRNEGEHADVHLPCRRR